MRLPINCTVDYINDFLTHKESNELYVLLINQYQIDQARIIIEAGGRLTHTDSFKILFLTDELMDQKSHPEEIHGQTFAFKGKMLELKKKVEQLLKKEFDLAMCLYYPDGNYFAPYHSDLETSGCNTILPSISLGAVREFSFRANTGDECYNLKLANGSLIIMGAYCQSRYTHSLVKNQKCAQGRINITFRERNFQ